MSKRTEIFQDILNEFESEELRSFCIDMLEISPQNFWSWATKEHDFAGGLIVQTILGCLRCNYLLRKSNIEKPKKKDCVRAAAMFRHVNPSEIEKRNVVHDIKPGLRKFIADLIRNCSKKETPEQSIIYKCYEPDLDYNQVLNSDIKDKITDVALPDPENYFFTEGPYTKCNFCLVYEMDKDYLYWLRDSSKYTYVEEPLRTYLMTELEDHNVRTS